MYEARGSTARRAQLGKFHETTFGTEVKLANRGLFRRDLCRDCQSSDTEMSGAGPHLPDHLMLEVSR
jgi:hypothetical protein